MRLMKMSNSSNMNIVRSPGKIRPAQLITTYGPGAFVQMEKDSVMIMGIDFWENKEHYIRKHHLYLQKITKRDHFRMPYSKDDKKTIACRSYPEWGHCSKCKWLQHHKTAPESIDHFVCRIHTKTPLLPARLVVCCKRGHVSDFPWIEWAHSNTKDPKPICESPKIKWCRGDRSSSISDSSVECDCGAQNYLTNAFNRNGVTLYDGNKEYTYECKGELPWLNKQVRCKKILENGETDNSKTETSRAMLVRSTSLYYPKIIRGIIIPHLAHPVARFIQSEEYRPFEELPVLKKMNYEEKALQIIEANYNNLGDKFKADEIVEIMKKIEERESKFDIETESDLKEIEYDDLITNKVYEDDQDEKEIQISNVELNDESKEYFDVVRKLDILTAIEVSRYFTRLRPPGEINDRTDNMGKNYICGLEVAGKSKSDVKHRKNNWLPCVVKKGEGIFIIFNKKFIEKCLNKSDVEKRLVALLGNYQRWEKESGWPRTANIDKQYILLHSFSHILIKEIAQLSGYSEASISERIYSSKNMCGILIYTTSSGDGSLGGLVKQANCLYGIFNDALKKAESCSRDPICIHEDPEQMIKNGVPLHLAQNGSACYGCIMLPETCCECFNKMLDRRTLPNRNFSIDEMADD